MSSTSSYPIKDVSEIDLPDRYRIPPLPLDELKVGKGIEIEISDPKDKTTIRQRMYRFQKKHPHVRLSLRKIDDTTMALIRKKDRT